MRMALEVPGPLKEGIVFTESYLSYVTKWDCFDQNTWGAILYDTKLMIKIRKINQQLTSDSIISPSKEIQTLTLFFQALISYADSTKLFKSTLHNLKTIPGFDDMNNDFISHNNYSSRYKNAFEEWINSIYARI